MDQPVSGVIRVRDQVNQLKYPCLQAALETDLGDTRVNVPPIKVLSTSNLATVACHILILQPPKPDRFIAFSNQAGPERPYLLYARHQFTDSLPSKS